jgi:multidrug efflux pump subunit AcrA (membrane-fusion protein)
VLVAQEVALRLRSRPLRPPPPARANAPADGGGDDHGVVRIALDVLDEAAVDLDAVDREQLQVGQRRIAGAEVVDRQLDAARAQLAQQRAACFPGRCIAADSVISSSSSDGSMPCWQQLVEARQQAAAVELARRQVDRQPQPASPSCCHSASRPWRVPAPSRPAAGSGPIPRRSE